ncbi:alpha/beta hydrolase [Piscinibacter sakaiensis]|uniref:alpha/beta hydrolase n=1 Tax=Piscinibacter sakaiensis TaxID=1547922 RepID=UPI003AABB780
MTSRIAEFVRRRWLTLALAGLLGSGVLAGCASFDTQMRKWIFQPAPAQSWQGTPRQRHDGIDDVWIEYRSEASGQPVRLHGLWAAHADPQAPLLLYLHGARRHVESSGWRIRNMRELGFSVLAIDYRGFGASTDELPSEESAVEDAVAAWDWLGARFPQQPRYIFGHSLGGAIAIALAARTDDERGLIVEGTFTSVADVFRSWRWGWLPLTPLIGKRFDSAAQIARVGSPVLVVHGSDDGTIKPQLGRQLYARAAEPKRFVLVDGGTHHNANRLGQAQYREAIEALFGIGRQPAQRTLTNLVIE